MTTARLLLIADTHVPKRARERRCAAAYMTAVAEAGALHDARLRLPLRRRSR